MSPYSDLPGVVLKESHATVLLHPGGNAQALLTWRANTATGPAPFNPDIVHVTPPDEHAYLWAAWPGGPVLGGEIAAWPLRAAPAGPFPAGTGTISGPFNGICMTLAADGTTVVARQCGPGVSSQMWTGYSNGTLRIHSRCLDVTGPGVGAKAKVAACTGAASQKWEIGQVSANDFGPITNAGTGTVLSYPRGSIADGTPLVMGLGNGDQSTPGTCPSTTTRPAADQCGLAPSVTCPALGQAAGCDQRRGNRS
jgi:hypothetical protein